MNNVHKDHRSRVRERFLKEGLEHFSSHNILEVMLFYSLPRKDTNPIAHDLIRTFGSLSRVMDAPIEQLMEVDGISENSAVLLKLIPQICRKYYIEKVEEAKNIETDPVKALGTRLVAEFIGEVREHMVLICLDNRMKQLSMDRISEGVTDVVSVRVRKIAEIALAKRASNIVIAHNHPDGLAIPSRTDRITTFELLKTLDSIGIKLVDHIIVSADSYMSMAQAGILSEAMGNMESANRFCSDDTADERLSGYIVTNVLKEI